MSSWKQDIAFCGLAWKDKFHCLETWLSKGNWTIISYETLPSHCRVKLAFSKANERPQISSVTVFLATAWRQACQLGFVCRFCPQTLFTAGHLLLVRLGYILHISAVSFSSDTEKEHSHADSRATGSWRNKHLGPIPFLPLSPSPFP